MSKIITNSTSRETMKVSPIVLRETKTTRLVFSPSWVETSENPLRGVLGFKKNPRMNLGKILTIRP